MYSVRVNRTATNIPLVTSAIHFFYPFNDTTYNVLLVNEVAEGNLGGATRGSGTIQASVNRLNGETTCSGERRICPFLALSVAARLTRDWHLSRNKGKWATPPPFAHWILAHRTVKQASSNAAPNVNGPCNPSGASSPSS